MKKTYSPRDILPLEIGSYLQDTAHLDATKSGAYIHLLMHYWLHGPIPDNDECLAAVARVSTDTWRIAKDTVMSFFKLGPDRRWHQDGTDRRRDVVMAKHKKRHEASVKANLIRWARHRELHRGENLGESSDTNRIQSDKLPPKVLPQVSRALPSLSPNPEMHYGEDARAHTVNVGLGQVCSLGGVVPWPVEQMHFLIKQSKGENAINALQAFSVTTEVESIHAKANGSRKPPKNSSNLPLKNYSNPTFTDLRSEIFRREIFRFWEQLNPGADPVPWTRYEEVAFSSFLKLHPRLDLEGFKELLRNRAQSDGVNSRERPGKWVGDLDEFSAGPLDRYRQVKRRARVL